MDSKKEEVFKFISEQNLLEGEKILSSNAVWSFSQSLTLLSFNTGTISGQYSITEFHLNPSTDKIISAGFIEYLKKIFIYCNRNKNPTLLLIYIDELNQNPTKYLTVLLSSLYFHNNVYNVCSPFTDSFCVISKEGISIHSVNDLSILYEKYWISNSILGCCFHEDIVAIYDHKCFSVYKFSSKDKCERLIKIKQNPSVMTLRYIFSSDNNAILVSTNNAQKILIKIIIFQPFSIIEKNIDFLISYSDISFDQILFSLFDNTLLVSTPKSTLLIDLQGAKPISLGKIIDKPMAQIVNENYLVSKTNNKLYEFQENYQSFTDPCSFELIGAIIRRKNGLQIAFEKLMISLKMREKVTSSMIDSVVKAVGAFATSPIAQIRFSSAIMYCGITNPHLILLGLLRYSNTLQSKLIPEARKPLLDILSKEEIVHVVPSLLNSWNQKLNKDSMEILLEANSAFYELDSSFFQNPNDFIRACIESGKSEKAMTLILMETTSGKKSNELVSIIELYIQKFGDNIQRSYKKLMMSVSSS